MTSTDRLAEHAASEARLMAAEIERLRARIAELEAANDAMAGAAVVRDVDTAVTFGTLAPPPDPADMPTVYSHNVKPSAPPHDE